MVAVFFSPPTKFPMTPEYVPTPAQIEAACDAIQATWTNQERAARRGKVPRINHQGDVERVKRDAGSALALKLAMIREAVA